MSKKLALILILCNLTAYTQPNQLTTIEELTCTGPLSIENQEFITSIMSKLGISKTVKIRKPIPELASYLPILNFQLYDHTCGIWFINEEWFNTLSEQERIFMIGYGAELIEHGREKHNKRQRILLATSLIAEFVLLYGSYKIINSFPSLLSFENSPTKSLLFACGVYGVVSFCVLTPLAKQHLQECDIRLAKEIDAKVVNALDCHQGAVSYLQKMETAIEPLLVQDATYWKPLYVSFKPRIATLEALTYAN